MKQLWSILTFIWRHPLAKRRKWTAYAKFFGWQINQKIYRRPVVCTLVEDSVLLVEKGMTGATGNIYTGLLEFEDMAFVLHVLRQGDLFGDIGANIGVYTVLASKNAGAGVIAIEPIPSTIEKLKGNIQLNQISESVTLLAYVVGSGKEPPSVWFTQNLDTINHVAGVDELIDKKLMVEIPVKTIDYLFSGKEPVILKIDIEGFEWPALNGALTVLSSSSIKGLIIELNGSGKRYGYADEEIHQLLLSSDFKPYSYDPFLRKFTPVPTFGNMNTIYIKDLDWVSERVRSARKFHILKQWV